MVKIKIEPEENPGPVEDAEFQIMCIKVENTDDAYPSNSDGKENPYGQVCNAEIHQGAHITYQETSEDGGGKGCDSLIDRELKVEQRQAYPSLEMVCQEPSGDAERDECHAPFKREPQDPSVPCPDLGGTPRTQSLFHGEEGNGWSLAPDEVGDGFNGRSPVAVPIYHSSVGDSEPVTDGSGSVIRSDHECFSQCLPMEHPLALGGNTSSQEIEVMEGQGMLATPQREGISLQESLHVSDPDEYDVPGARNQPSDDTNKILSYEFVKSHLKTITPVKLFQCSICGHKVAQKGDLNKHMRIHTGERPYRCSVCAKSFARKDSLSQHMRIHSGEKPYQCSMCGMSFTQRNSLSHHLKKTHAHPPPPKMSPKSRKVKETSFESSDCSLNMSQKADLIKHKSIGEKPYKCNFCGKDFSRQGILNKHMRTHSGEKPYQCSVCSLKMSQKADLVKHMRTHTGEKPYKCHLCGKNFSRKDILNQHMRTHSGEKPYQCYECGQGFSHRFGLSRHLGNSHTGVEPHKMSPKSSSTSQEFLNEESPNVPPLDPNYIDAQHISESPVISSDMETVPEVPVNSLHDVKSLLLDPVLCHSTEDIPTDATMSNKRKEASVDALLPHAGNDITGLSMSRAKEDRFADMSRSHQDIRNFSDESSMSCATEDNLVESPVSQCGRDNVSVDQFRLHQNAQVKLEVEFKPDNDVKTMEYGSVESYESQKDVDYSVDLLRSQPDMIVQSRNLSYQCCQCMRDFSHQNDLSEHLINCNIGKSTPKTHISSDTFRYVTEEKLYECLSCTYKSFLKHDLIKHTRIHTDERPYQCSICKKSFRRKDTLSQHMITHSRKNSGDGLKCCECKKSFPHQSALSVHLRNNHTRKNSLKIPIKFRYITKKKLFECLSCEYKSYLKHDITKHTRIHTGERPYQCLICKKSFCRKDTLYQHMRTHSGEKPYQCSECRQSLSHRYGLTLHWAKAHAKHNSRKGLVATPEAEAEYPDVPDTFEGSTMPFDMHAVLGNPIRTHSDPEFVIVDPPVSHRKADIPAETTMAHQSKDDPADALVPQDAGDDIRGSSMSLANNLFSDSSKPQYINNVSDDSSRYCGTEDNPIQSPRLQGKQKDTVLGLLRSDQDVDDLAEQFRPNQSVTDGEDGFVDSFRSYGSVKDSIGISRSCHNMTQHNRNGLYICCGCKKSFPDQNALSEHLRNYHTRKHTLKKPIKFRYIAEGKLFECLFCKYKSTLKHDITKHATIHTGERPYQCLICKKSFHRKDTLYQHMRTHSGEKPYQCKECSESFSHRNGLTLHCGKVHTRCNRRGFVATHIGEDESECLDVKDTSVVSAMSGDMDAVLENPVRKQHDTEYVEDRLMSHSAEDITADESMSHETKDASDAVVHQEAIDDIALSSVSHDIEGVFVDSSRSQDIRDISENPARYCDTEGKLKESPQFLGQEKDTILGPLRSDRDVDDDSVEYFTPHHSVNDVGDGFLDSLKSHEDVDDAVPLSRSRQHATLHSAEMLYPCCGCKKSFPDQYALSQHLRDHHTKNISLKVPDSTDKYIYISEEKLFECLSCDYTSILKHDLIKHSRTHTNERPYQCLICKKSFRRKDTLYQHMTIHSGEKPYKCIDCSESFSHRYGLTQHRGKVHTECNEQEDLQTAHESHVEAEDCDVQHSEDLLLSSYIDTVREGSSQSKPHLKFVLGESLVPEVLEDSSAANSISSETKDDLLTRGHVGDNGRPSMSYEKEGVLADSSSSEAITDVSDYSSKYHGTKAILRDSQLLQFERNHALDLSKPDQDVENDLADYFMPNHLQNNGKEGLVPSIGSHGDFDSSSNAQLQGNMVEQSGNMQYQCYDYTKNFPHQNSLSDHLRNHYARNPTDQIPIGSDTFRYVAEEKLYECLSCNNKSLLKHELIKHARIHSNERPYPCSICKKTFRRKVSHSQHMITHLRDRFGDSFQCCQCEKSFPNENALSDHLKNHHTRKHAPKISSESFRYIAEEKVFECLSCNYRSSLKHDLIKHTRIHTGERPYQCLICKKNFRRKDTLYQHMRTHSGEKPYQCNECSESFSHRYGLTQHWGKVHKKCNVQEDHAIAQAGEVEAEYFEVEQASVNSLTSSHMKSPIWTQHDAKDVSVGPFLSNKDSSTDANVSCENLNMLVDPIVPQENEESRGSSIAHCDNGYVLANSPRSHQDVKNVSDDSSKPYTEVDLAELPVSQFEKVNALVDRSSTFLDVEDDSSNQVRPLHYEKGVHKGDKRNAKPFKCSICSLRMTQKADLVKHLRTHTGEKPFQCEICGKSFSRKDILTQHMRIHSGEKPYQCHECDQKFAHRYGLSTHWRKAHVGMKCPKMSSVKKTTQTNEDTPSLNHQEHNLSQHLRTHEEEESYDGSVCKKSLSGMDNSYQDVKVDARENSESNHANFSARSSTVENNAKRGSDNDTDQYDVEDVLVDPPISFNNLKEDTQIDPMMSHPDKEDVLVDAILISDDNHETEEDRSMSHIPIDKQLQNDVDQGTSLSQNVLTNSEQKIHQCSMCSYQVTRKADLTKHMRTHTGQKPYSCLVCSKSFARKDVLAQHMTIHSAEKPFSCSLCGMRFMRKSLLSEHMNDHTGETPFQCSHCEMKFAHRAKLYYHMKSHTEREVYQCSVCDYQVYQKGDLVKHMRKHTGEKPYACTMCSKRFSRKDILTEHIRTHTGDMPYPCSLCSLKFSRKALLSQHMNTHTEETPFECTQCEMKFTHKRKLNHHIKTHRE